MTPKRFRLCRLYILILTILEIEKDFLKINKFIYLFIYISGCIGSLLLCAGFLWLQRVGAPLYCRVRASHCSGFSCFRARALGTRASVVVAHRLSSCGTRAQQLWHTSSRAQAQQWFMGLVAPQHVGSSPARAQTHVPCIGRWILNHCATREALKQKF